MPKEAHGIMAEVEWSLTERDVLAKVGLVGGLEGEEDDVPIRVPVPATCLCFPSPFPFLFPLPLRALFPITDTLARGAFQIRR